MATDCELRSLDSTVSWGERPAAREHLLKRANRSTGTQRKITVEVEFKVLRDKEVRVPRVWEKRLPVRDRNVDHLDPLGSHRVKGCLEYGHDLGVVRRRRKVGHATDAGAPQPGQIEERGIGLRDVADALGRLHVGRVVTDSCVEHDREVSNATGERGPPISCVEDSGTIPVRLESPCVPRRPTRLLKDAGTRIEPQVSLPMPTAAKLAAMAAPVPLLEPPALRVRT